MRRQEADFHMLSTRWALSYSTHTSPPRKTIYMYILYYYDGKACPLKMKKRNKRNCLKLKM